MPRLSAVGISGLQAGEDVKKADKTLAKMRSNPRDWQMASLEVVAKRHGIEVRKTGGSHFVFLHPASVMAVTIPFNRPIKPVYSYAISCSSG